MTSGTEEASSLTQPLMRWNDRPPQPTVDREPTTVSVVIPHFEVPGQLALTLTGLSHQEFPASRLQVVVADDGSSHGLAPDIPDGLGFDCHIVRQEHQGFGAGRARNLGARAAEGDVLVFLDADMIPESKLVAVHEAVHADIDYGISVGHRRHVAMDDLSIGDLDAALSAGQPIADAVADRPASPVAWRDDLITDWAGLTAEHAEGWRVASSGNLSLTADFFIDVGGFDERFRRWGGEDIELAFRATQAGALFVHSPEAMAWHQGIDAVPDPSERAAQRRSHLGVTDLIAAPGLRAPYAARGWTVPYLVVEMTWTPSQITDVTRIVEELLTVREGAAVVLDLAESDQVLGELDLAALLSDGRVATRPTPSSWARAPYRAEVTAPNRVTATDLLSAVHALRTGSPRPAVVQLHDKKSTIASVWTVAAAARLRRCGLPSAVSGEHFPTVCLEAGGQPPGTYRDVDESLREIQDFYWSLPKGVRSAIRKTVSRTARVLRHGS